MSTEQKKLQIRRSKPEDLQAMMRIYEKARAFMKEHGNPRQWGATNWPPVTLLQEDIRLGRSYVVCTSDGRVVGTFVYLFGPDIEPTYANIKEGKWLGSNLRQEEGNPYGVVHRLAGDGSVKGIGEASLRWAYAQSWHLRVDTHPDNVIMQKLLTKLGFVRCGIIYVVEDRDPRYAYEKLPEK
jgi:hypothetical protein